MTEPAPGTDVIARTGELDKYARLGKWLAASEADTGAPADRGASAALRLYYAAELGLPPMAAAELSVIKGRLFVQSKLLRAMAAQRGYRVRRDPASDDTSCTAILELADGTEVGRTTFTMQDAQRAGLVRDRSAWKTHPARMLWARASKFCLDDFAPEVTLGLATVDELDEIRGNPTPPPVDDLVADEADWEPVPTPEQEIEAAAAAGADLPFE